MSVLFTPAASFEATSPISLSCALARREASNSTGSVTIWKRTATAYSAMPMYARAERAEDEAAEQEEQPDLGRELHGREHRAPELEERVGVRMLDRVADLVRTDGGRGDRDAPEDLRREMHRAVARVVMVGERPRCLLDGDLWSPFASRMRRATWAGHPVRDRDLEVAGECALPRCWAQRPIAIGTMNARRKYMSGW